MPVKSSKLPKSKVTPAKKSGLSIDVYDLAGKVTGSINLPEEIFGAKVNDKLMAQAVRVHLANIRGGHASTKTRGEVQGSTRKIYKQKGTGRARHGGIRAPIFVGGGIAFGPKPHDFSLSFPKKMRKAALFSALSEKAHDKEIKVVKNLETLELKTKAMSTMLKNLEIPKRQKNLLLILSENNDALWKAGRNIEGLSLTTAKQMNTYDVLKSRTIVFMESAIDVLSKHFVS